MELLNQITDWADKFTIWIATFTLIISGLNWWNNRKGNDNIIIKIQHQEQSKTLAQTIKRRHLTRSEVQGVLSNAYHSQEKGQRYNIPHLASKEFSDHLENVQNGKTQELIINIEQKKEYDTFKCE